MIAADRPIEARTSFDFIRYANCWEDSDILCEALCPSPGKKFLSIASAVDNSLALAADGANVVAVDLNPAQLACSELKCAAIGNLPYEQVLQFFGITHSNRRLETFGTLEWELSTPTRDFWRRNSKALEEGFIHSGKFERYFQLFRKRVLPLVAGPEKVRRLLAERSESERRSFYDREWDTWRWRTFFKLFFSRFVMGRLGRDKEFFRYVEGSVGERILERARKGLTDIPTHSNPYLHYILCGNYSAASLPRYLRPENFDRSREGVKRLTLELGSIDAIAQRAGPNSFDGYNLSDIFEYMDKSLVEQVYGRLLNAARSGARFAYWNMLVPRKCPDVFGRRVRRLPDLAHALFECDRAFFYSAFQVEEVL